MECFQSTAAPPCENYRSYVLVSVNALVYNKHVGKLYRIPIYLANLHLQGD